MSQAASSEQKQESTSKDTERHVDTEATNPDPFSTGNKLHSTWSVRDIFGWNPSYLFQIRGVLNLITLVLNLITLILLGIACQLTPVRGPPMGFYCYPADTFVFVVACSSFMNAALIILCCLLSSKTNQLLYNTSYELSYYVMYFVLYFTSGIALIVSLVNRNKERLVFEEHYSTSMAGGAIGVFSGVFYGISAVWFFICHL